MNPAAIVAMCKGKNRSKLSPDEIHTAAQAFGATGGEVGGPARADALTQERRTAIVRHAANVRWGNHSQIQMRIV